MCSVPSGFGQKAFVGRTGFGPARSTNRWARAARALYSWHQIAGAFSPVLLFLHSTRLGFGYLLLLSTVYVANNVVGLVSPSVFPRLEMLVPFWVIAHIALSVLLAALVVYHAWTALSYE